jgi:hypothetical protein
MTLSSAWAVGSDSATETSVDVWTILFSKTKMAPNGSAPCAPEMPASAVTV